MKLAALPTGDPWFACVLERGKAHVEILTDVPVDVSVLVGQVTLLHRGPDRNYRPCLHVQGRMLGVQAPTVALPYGLTHLEFEGERGPLVDAFYEFSRPQLAQLALKGYFEPGFTVPEQMTDVAWVLPATARIVLVHPGSFDEPPVVFCDVVDAQELWVDEQSCGYELVAYFPDRSREHSDPVLEPAPTLALEVDDLDLQVDGIARDHDRGGPHPGLDEEPIAPQESPKSTRDEALEEAYQRNVLERLHGGATLASSVVTREEARTELRAPTVDPAQSVEKADPETADRQVGHRGASDRVGAALPAATAPTVVLDDGDDLELD